MRPCGGNSIRGMDERNAAWNADGATLLEWMRIPEPRAGEILLLVAMRTLFSRISPAMLSDEERERLRRFRCGSSRERFLAAHGLKRLALARLLRRPPERLRFDSAAMGKPFLHGADLHFSLSHSGDWVALAVSLDAPVGVDVEQPRLPAEELPVDMVFHPEDRIVPARSEEERFYIAWTLKEAAAKCAGHGLHLSFSSLCLDCPESSERGAEREETEEVEAAEAVEALEEAGCYRIVGSERIWRGRHGSLRGGAHLAVASEARWTALRLLFIR